MPLQEWPQSLNGIEVRTVSGPAAGRNEFDVTFLLNEFLRKFRYVFACSVLLPQERLISHEAFDVREQFGQHIRGVFARVHVSQIENRPSEAVPRDGAVAVKVAVGSPQLPFGRTRIPGEQPQSVVVVIEAMVGPDDSCI